MALKINITPELRKAIKTAIEKDRDNKLIALESLSVRRSSLEDIQAARDAFDKAEAQAMAASKLIAGVEAEYNVTTGQLSWGELPDHRPQGWQDGWSFRVPSRSGGPDHEVTVASRNRYGTEEYESACNCKGGNFYGKCHAQEDIVNSLKGWGSVPSGARRVWPEQRTEDFGKRRESYDD
jgi:hypothetical protein